MAKRIIDYPLSTMTVIFWTTQTDSDYAGKLANMIPANRRILVDDFCDRSLPCSQYSHWVPHDTIVHLNNPSWIEIIRALLKTSNQPSTILVYGSFYLVGEIMKLSRYQPFASE
jgi:folylpolyglutamate synthase/dihydropteroate synthase